MNGGKQFEDDGKMEGDEGGKGGGRHRDTRS
jgi:hypothetical protein